ncbi:MULTISPECIES: DUF6397 family protein [Streptomyces]|uniref:Uncharacterized protein n=2 Tax=Streptomyces TaxID=1883 RepID=A0A100Y9N6_9ACTN|nr:MULTISPECIES: DUF6397 family protein [Streptomyces]KUH40305.1 hypothetical protein ATE80_03180 [Streptomyces kanasensis]UUS34301.1 DUF6397 family protein [Streptomyces changanensis]
MRDDQAVSGGRDGDTVTGGRAARELGLGRGEMAAAVDLGLVRSLAAAGGGRPRVAWEEIDRLRAEPDFPDGLHDRVGTAGTARAAETAGISPDRFTRLARTGHVTPIAFHLNRYRAVVWLYLAREVRQLTEKHPQLLTGRAPRHLTDRLRAGEDARPCGWRARRLRLLVARAPDAWAVAAAVASFLDAERLAEVVPDPSERARLDRLRPPPPYGHPEVPSARAVADRLLLAEHRHEGERLRLALTEALQAARGSTPRSSTPIPAPPALARHLVLRGPTATPAWHPGPDLGRAPTPPPSPAAHGTVAAPAPGPGPGADLAWAAAPGTGTGPDSTPGPGSSPGTGPDSTPGPGSSPGSDPVPDPVSDSDSGPGPGPSPGRVSGLGSSLDSGLDSDPSGRSGPPPEARAVAARPGARNGSPLGMLPGTPLASQTGPSSGAVVQDHPGRQRPAPAGPAGRRAGRLRAALRARLGRGRSRAVAGPPSG